MIKTAFSLIELMIVITIIGILAAVAVPSYQNYVIKTRVASTLPVFNQIFNTLIEYHQINGSMIPTLETPDGSVATGGTIATGQALVQYYHYNASGNDDAWFCEHFGVSLGVPGLVQAGGGVNNRVCIRLRYVNGNYIKQCGHWGTGPVDLDVVYLPGGCNCPSVSTNACE